MDDAKKIAEKHVFKNSGFGKYTETEVAQTLRSGSGDTHGGGENLVVFCPLKAIGFDDFNLTPTFEKTMTLQASRADTHHLPVVFIRSEKE
jgi:hypothetical protein